MMNILVSREPSRVLNRRVTDKVMSAFEQACDHSELDVAHELLCLLETMLERPDMLSPQDRRANIESLVDAHYRLWMLRNAAPRGLASASATRHC